MRSIINELWHGNIIPQEDSRNNTKEMKELLCYMSRHHEDLEKSFTDEQKEIARLKRELRDTQDALDVLKKAISILGK